MGAPNRSTSMSSAFGVIHDPRFVGRVAVGSALLAGSASSPCGGGPTLCSLRSRSMMEVMWPREMNGDG